MKMMIETTSRMMMTTMTTGIDRHELFYSSTVQRLSVSVLLQA